MAKKSGTTARDRKRNKRKYGMKVTGRSVFIIQGAVKNRSRNRRQRRGHQR